MIEDLLIGIAIVALASPFVAWWQLRREKDDASER